MGNTATIVGIHEIDAEEPVHLIEIELTGDVAAFDFRDITQPVKGQRRDNWQAAYDERQIDSPTSNPRFAFFFHYLDLSLPLSTSFGDLAIPPVTPLSERLVNIEYEPP